MSMHPLPMNTKQLGARIAGRKMSEGTLKKVLEKLTSEGYNFANSIDLRTHWARHVPTNLQQAVGNLLKPFLSLEHVKARCFYLAKNMYHGYLGYICKPISSISRPKCSYLTDTYCKFTTDPLVNQLAMILQDVSDASLLQQGRQTHAQIVATGMNANSFLGGKILSMYVLCGRIMDAKNVFHDLPVRHTSNWNWMIRGYAKMGLFHFVLLCYFKMLGSGVSPDKYTFPCVVKACCSLNHLSLGKIVHQTVNSMGQKVDVFLGSSLIKLYADNGHLDDAQDLFDSIPERDCVLWNVMLDGYVKNGDSRKAMTKLTEMRCSETKPNSVTYTCILTACGIEAMVDFGFQLHGLLIRCGMELVSEVSNTLLAMYLKCQRLSEGRKLFDVMSQRDVVSWNAFISGYVQNGLMAEAEDLFRGMISSGIKPDGVTFASFLPCIAEFSSLKHGKEIYCYMLRGDMPLDLFLKSALIDVFFKCWDVKMAQKIFGEGYSGDVVVCAAMISGYALNGRDTEALEIFRWFLRQKMKPNPVMVSSVLPSCAGLAALNLGKELHGSILKSGIDDNFHVGCAVLDMYAKCGRLDLGRQVFHRMSRKDAICWNSMISNCSQNGKPDEALRFFRQMGVTGSTQYDSVSISSALSACANLPSLRHGKEIHGFITRVSFASDIFTDSALIDMYAKCGNLTLARGVFDFMQEKNEVSWNSIISAYGSHGHVEESLNLFHKMLEQGIQPDHVTFLGIISACAHSGRVDEGIHYYQCMTKNYKIPARMEHYACIVDLFGRAGRLNEAVETVNSMPFLPDAGVWGTLIGACRVHGNAELAELAARHLFRLDPLNSGYYVLLANTLADSGNWRSVQKVRSKMKERGVQKVPGYSWIDVNNITHMFVAADGRHPAAARIKSILDGLLLELRREGYVPQLFLPFYPQNVSTLTHEQFGD